MNSMAGDVGQTKGPGIHQRTRDAADSTMVLLQRLTILRERLVGCEASAQGKADAPAPDHLEFTVGSLLRNLGACETELSRIEQGL